MTVSNEVLILDFAHLLVVTRVSGLAVVALGLQLLEFGEWLERRNVEISVVGQLGSVRLGREFLFRTGLCGVRSEKR